MGYILLLLIAIGAILSFAVQGNPLSGTFEKTRASIVDYVTPRTQTEIIIDNLAPSHQALERFFTQTAPEVIKSRTLSAQEQRELESAIEAFSESRQAIEDIRQAERSENGVTETIVKKLLNMETTPRPLTSPSPSASPAISTTPAATPVPPHCRVEC